MTNFSNSGSTSMVGGATSMEDPGWIDGIIKDLIQTSNSISIPQLIQNVREIIYPCNPNLGAVIEFRLRSLADPLVAQPLPPPPPHPTPTTTMSHPQFHKQQNQQPGFSRISNTSNSIHQPGLHNNNKAYYNSNLSDIDYFSPLAAAAAECNANMNWGGAAMNTPPSSLPRQQQPQQQQPLSINEGGCVGGGGNSNNSNSMSMSNQNPLQPDTSHAVEGNSDQNPENNLDSRGSDPGVGSTTTVVVGTEESPSTVVGTPPAPTPPPPQQVTAVAREREREELRQRKRDEEGLHLLTLLLQCAEAVSADKFDDANKMLVEISEWATPFGTSAQRVAAYFSEAMSARLVSSCLGIHTALPSIPHYQKLVSAFQVFNGISPFVKFSHFTANQAIQEAFQREERVHIIDLDIMQGLQWPGLFHILASRPGGPPFVRLTGLGTSMEALEATGKRLSDFAEKLGLPFEFIPVAEKIGNLDLERLHVSKREAVAVHWLQHSLYDVTGSDTNTLWLLQR